MATTKKTQPNTKKSNSNKLKQKRSFLHQVHVLSEMDTLHSVFIASILFNIVFFICVFVFTSTDTFDGKLLNFVQDRYCQNRQALQDRASIIGADKAIEEWHVTCVSKDFRPYYKEAVEKFRAQDQAQ